MPYDVALPHASALDDARLRIGVQFFPEQAVPTSLAPLLDTGAELSVFDGNAAEYAGWTMEEIARRALDVRPISGLGRGGRPLDGYLHESTCYVVIGARFVELRLRALITPPNSLNFPVLGRAGFRLRRTRWTSPSQKSKRCSIYASATRPSAGSSSRRATAAPGTQDLTSQR